MLLSGRINPSLKSLVSIYLPEVFMFIPRKSVLSVFASALALLSITSCLAVAQDAALARAPLAPTHLVTAALPSVRVTAKVDNSQRVMLTGHVSSALRHATDLGRLDRSTPVEHIVMVLKSSDEQIHELHRVLDEQQDKNSPNYHQWVTPQQFGEHFGVSDADIAQITTWLQSQGMRVDDVSSSKRVLHFSGTIGQLEGAFQTEIHSYQVNGEVHAANNSDITVPKALNPVISAVSLNNFFRKGHMGPVNRLKNVQPTPTEVAQPRYGAGTSSTHYVGPWDFATIYNTFPLLNTGITGKGSSIAVVGRSDILLSDVQSYRALFDLPNNDPIFIHAGQDNGIQPGDDGESDLDVEISGGIAPNAQVYFVIGTPTFFVDGITNSIEYIVENNTADIMSISYGSCESAEGAGGNAFNNQAFEQAAAQGISIFVAAGDNGPAECDNQNDSWEVYGYSTGGESSTPYNVSVGGSQGYEANSYWGTTELTPPYWGLSALSYIPEVPWNESKGADKSLDSSSSLSGLWSGSGGISSYYIQPSWQRGSGVPTTDPAYTQGGNWVTGITLTNGGGSGYTTAPTVTFTGGGCIAEPTATANLSSGSVSGITFTYFTSTGTEKTGQGFGCTSAPTVAFSAAPAGGTTATATVAIGPMLNTPALITGVPHRYTPDLVLNAASGHDATLFCSEGSCQFTTSGSSTTLVDAGLVGGTSVAAPSMAGIQALINQANGGRQGMPGYIYYALSAAQTEANCNSATPPASGAGCAFQDITLGDNYICGYTTCSSTTPNNKMGWPAGVGYDLATGLGSVNAYNLSSQWKNVVFNSSNTTLNLSQTTGIAQGTPVTITGTVTPSSGSGTPTGNVAFIVSNGIIGQTLDVSGDANNGAFNGPTAVATLSNGSYSATLSSLPAGSYTVTARYGGDGTYASSLSAPVPVTVSPGNATVTISTGNINVGTCYLYTPATLTYGSSAYFTINVASNTGAGVPTGTLTLTVDGATWGTIPLDPNGNGYLIAGNTNNTSSCLYGYIFSQGALLTGGTHTIGASYSGDGTFTATTATPATVTVGQIAPTVALSAGAQNISSGFNVPLVSTFTVPALTSISALSATGPTGTVTYTDTTTGTVLGTATLTPTVTYSNTATSTSTYPSYTYGAVGTASTTGITTTGANSITATYSGDTNYLPVVSSAATVTVDVPTATTTTTVTSSANPTTVGGRPTFTATIGISSGTAPTSGTVTFYDGSTLMGTGTVGTAHTATFKPGTSYALTGGAHTITAVYGGIAAAGPSTSAPFTENVTKTTGTLTMSMKTSGLVGQTFAFSAVLPANAGTVYTPTGNVQFFDNGRLVGTGVPFTTTAVLGGYGIWEATYNATGLTAGTHPITATYSDANYTYSTAAATNVKVYGSPVGNLELAVDAATSQPTIPTTDTLFVSGWVGDPVDGSPVGNVKVYIDGVSYGTPTLGVSRPDVVSYTGNSAYAASGYTFTLAASTLAPGTHAVTVVAIDTGGQTTTFGPLSITVTAVYPPPVGNLEAPASGTTTSVAINSSVNISGWIADPTDGSPMTNVTVYIDGVSVGKPALGISRPDVVSYTGNSAYANSGFSLAYSVAGLAAGTHSVTVVGTNSHSISTTFGPSSFTVTDAPPVGNLELAVDSVTAQPTVSQSTGTLFVSGWAADYLDNGPAQSVQILIDGTPVGFATLGGSRPDVASYFGKPAWTNSGYSFTVAASGLSTGSHSVTAVVTNKSGLTSTFSTQPITVTP